jgi:hypothetical protein
MKFRRRRVYDKMTDSEREVSEYLKKAELRWAFQFPVFVYDEEDRERLWTPDFYIPKLGLFIEVCGSKEFDYEYRKEIYEKNGIPVVFLHYYKRPEKWRFFLAKRVREIGRQRQSEAKKLTGFK